MHRKKSLYHATAHYTTQLLQSEYLVSTFGIEKVFSSMNMLPAFQKMLVSPTEFTPRPIGQAHWEESLVLFKIHS